MIIISSKNNPKIKDLYKLKSKKYRREFQMFLVEDKHMVEEALKAGCLIETFEFVDDGNAPIYKNSTLVSKQIIEHLSELDNPQNIIGLCKFKLKNEIGNSIIALNNVQDPGNIGTIIRVCRAFEVDTLLVENFDIYNSKILRASKGAFFSLNIVTTSNLLNDIIKFNGEEYKIISTSLKEGSKKLNEIIFPSKFVLIFGNEGSGIEKNILDVSDEHLYIPISFESLNVAVSVAIVLNKVRNG